jgi:hypothetical protein
MRFHFSKRWSSIWNVTQRTAATAAEASPGEKLVGADRTLADRLGAIATGEDQRIMQICIAGMHIRIAIMRVASLEQHRDRGGRERHRVLVGRLVLLCTLQLHARSSAADPIDVAEERRSR